MNTRTLLSSGREVIVSEVINDEFYVLFNSVNPIGRACSGPFKSDDSRFSKVVPVLNNQSHR